MARRKPRAGISHLITGCISPSARSEFTNFGVPQVGPSIDLDMNGNGQPSPVTVPACARGLPLRPPGTAGASPRNGALDEEGFVRATPQD